MRRFFYRIVFFAVSCALGVVGVWIFSERLIRQRESGFLQLNPNIQVVFAGDSNIEEAINDAVIPHSISIAASGEAYLYTYAKLQAILTYNPQVNSVFLGYAPHDLSKRHEIRCLYFDDWIGVRLVDYGYLLTLSEKIQLLKHNPKAFALAVPACVRRNVAIALRNATAQPFTMSVVGFGGYLKLDRNKLEEDKGRSLDEYQLFEKGESQLQYLLKISQLCASRSVKLILINTPKHNFYNSRLNAQEKRYWLDVGSKLCQAKVMDYSEYVLPDSCYADLTHLNYKGAEIFSKDLNSIFSHNPTIEPH